MNVILILLDSLNRHELPAYGATEVRTPQLDAFAKRAWRMDNHFVGSLPCMPARREIYSGFKELMWRPWGPLEIFDAKLPELLAEHSYQTAIVTDHYHYWETSANGYLQTFQSTELIRGHELDNWQSPLDAAAPVPAWVEEIDRWRDGFGRRYYANVASFETEEDFFPAKVMTSAAAWLKDNARKAPFFLQVESFDVHEPFHVPSPYDTMYWQGEPPPRANIWPPYQDQERMRAYLSQASDQELAYLRAQYKGKLSMVDRWLGRLFGTLDELNLWEDTAVILTTDHGHDLGDHQKFAKSYPHFDTHANIPMFLWHPQHPGEGKAVDAITQTVDLFSTILDIASVKAAPPHSLSVMPLIKGEAEATRDVALYGTFGQGVCFTDGTWTLMKSPVSDGPLYSYSSDIYQSLVAEESVRVPEDCGRYIPGVEMPQWKVPIRFGPLSSENFLFNRKEDPNQTRNLWDANPEERRRMLELLTKTIAWEGAPDEQYSRLGLERNTA